MRHVAPCLLALALGCAPALAADANAQGHANAAAQAKDAFAELDKLVKDDLTRMDDGVQKQAAAEQQKIEQVQAQASKAQVAAAVSKDAQKKAASDAAFDPASAGAKPNVLVTATDQDPEEIVDQLIEKAGLARGLNEGKGNAFVAVASVQVLENPGTAAYGVSRVNSYNQAYNIARLEIVKFVETTVSSGVAIDRIKSDQLPQGGDVTKSDQITAKVAALIEADLDAELKKRGIDPASVTPVEKRKTLENTVRQVIATEAAGEVYGASVFAIAEGKRFGKQHMTVAVLWSPNLQRMSQFLLSKGASALPTPVKGRPLKEQIPATAAELATRFGIKPCVDENGERWLIAFGQMGVDGDPADADTFSATASMGQKMAEDQAINAIKAFAFEQTSTKAASEIAETLQVYKKANGDTEKIKKTVSNLNEEIRSGSANIKIAGAVTLKSWVATVDGAPVVGVVKAWSAKSLRQAAELKKQMEDKGVPAKKPEAGGKGNDRHSDTPDQGSW